LTSPAPSLIDAVARELVDFINTGRKPADKRALMFVRGA